jgi:cation:H+ antiporter
VVMERAASDLGTTYGISEAVIGGIVLAAVTSLPNSVSAVYLALRQRGAATFSTGLNSNSLNVVVGLLLPATFLGLGARSSAESLTVAGYAGLTVAVLAVAFLRSGIPRGPGLAIIVAYLGFAVSLVVVAGH